MRITATNTLRFRQWLAYEGHAGVLIGRDEACQIKLDSRFVSARHARIDRCEAGWQLELLQDNAHVTLNGIPLASQRRHVLALPCRLSVGEFSLLVEESTGAGTMEDHSVAEATALCNEIHQALLDRLNLRKSSPAGCDADLQRCGELLGELIHGQFRARVFATTTLHQLCLRAIEERRSGYRPDGLGDAHQPEFEQQIESLLLRHSDNDDAVKLLPGRLLQNLREYLALRYLRKSLLQAMFGFGPLDDFLNDDRISEIMVVDPTVIYVEQDGAVRLTSRRFTSREQAITVIERIVAPLGRRIDRSDPLVDARLPDGSRVNAIIEPLAVRGPCITIRKFARRALSLDDLIRSGTLSSSAAALLAACVRYRANIIVAGGTGSGKTTLLNVLSGMIPVGERIVTIEDSAELRLQQQHVVTLETKPPSIDGSGRISIRDLLRNALRMRPDRIVVGECRGEETLDMLQAMNTGHRGSMTTVHANSASDVISRLETMVVSGSSLPIEAAQRQIADAVQLVVYVERVDGSRRVSQILEITGRHPITGELLTHNLFDCTGACPTAQPTGYLPSFIGELVSGNFMNMDQWLRENS